MGFIADPLSSDEFKYAMGSSLEDEDAVKAAADSPEEFVTKVTRNRFRLLSSDDDGCLNQFISKHGATESINADNSLGFDHSGGDQVDFIDSRFGETLPMVLEHAILQDFSVLMFSKSRS